MAKKTNQGDAKRLADELMRQAESRSADDDPQATRDYSSIFEPAEKPEEIGRLGRYRILRVLGSGGMGIAFQAQDVTLKRLVALKVMKPELAVVASVRQRFLREGQATAAIKNDHVVTIHQVGEENGVAFLAMEYLEGESLADRLDREDSLPVNVVLHLGKQIAIGLSAAHDCGLIHRDIKPSNIWLETVAHDPDPEAPPCRVKILDFGLVRASISDTRLTGFGAVVGTPAYMAPEQARSKPVDSRCDLFSLGAVLYHMATGSQPFKGRDTLAILSALANDEPVPPHRCDARIPRPLSKFILRLLEKDPTMRPPTAKAVAKMLYRIEQKLRSNSTEAKDPNSPITRPKSGRRPAGGKKQEATSTLSDHVTPPLLEGVPEPWIGPAVLPRPIGWRKHLLWAVAVVVVAATAVGVTIYAMWPPKERSQLADSTPQATSPGNPAHTNGRLETGVPFGLSPFSSGGPMGGTGVPELGDPLGFGEMLASAQGPFLVPDKAKDPQRKVYLSHEWMSNAISPMKCSVFVVDPTAPDHLLRLSHVSLDNGNMVGAYVDGSMVGYGSLLEGNWQGLPEFFGKHGGQKSHFHFRSVPISVTQTIEVVPGPAIDVGKGDWQSYYDTCVFQFRIENRDTQVHQIGWQFMYDVIVDDNDSPAYLVPGKSECVNNGMTLTAGKDLPDFILALAKQDLRNPGVVAQFSFRPVGCAGPDRVLITNVARETVSMAMGRMRWEHPLHAGILTDSVLVCYWEPVAIEPGQSRTLGIAVGAAQLGRLSERLAIVVGGNPTTKTDFTVVALVGDDSPDLTLQAPSSMTLISAAAQTLPAGAGPLNPRMATWQLRSDEAGEFSLAIKDRFGIWPQKLRISPPAPASSPTADGQP